MQHFFFSLVLCIRQMQHSLLCGWHIKVNATSRDSWHWSSSFDSRQFRLYIFITALGLIISVILLQHCHHLLKMCNYKNFHFFSRLGFNVSGVIHSVSLLFINFLGLLSTSTGIWWDTMSPHMPYCMALDIRPVALWLVAVKASLGCCL